MSWVSVSINLQKKSKFGNSLTEEKKIESKDSSTKGLLGGFGIPLLQIANIVQSVVDATRKQRIPPEKTDRMAIVTKPTGDVIEKYPAPNFPKFETGK